MLKDVLFTSLLQNGKQRDQLCETPKRAAQLMSSQTSGETSQTRGKSEEMKFFLGSEIRV